MLSEKNEEKTNIFLTRGKNRNSLIVACLYISSKNNKKPFKEKNILKMFNISKSDLTKGLKKFSLIERTKNLSINNNNIVIYNLIEYYGKQFNFEDNIIKILHLIYIRALKINILKNSNPKSICSGLLYFISYIFKLNVNKKNIIKIIQISEVTLNKIFNIFLNYEKVLLIGFNTIDFINIE
jgi:transcription initiation factor TFIIIB Brf1 subunit/transcription initiation factor TFIIB